CRDRPEPREAAAAAHGRRGEGQGGRGENQGCRGGEESPRSRGEGHGSRGGALQEGTEHQARRCYGRHDCVQEEIAAKDASESPATPGFFDTLPSNFALKRSPVSRPQGSLKKSYGHAI